MLQYLRSINLELMNPLRGLLLQSSSQYIQQKMNACILEPPKIRKGKTAHNVPQCKEFRKASRNPQITVCFHTLKGSDMKQTLLSCARACTRQTQAKVASTERHRGNPLFARGLQPTTVHLFRSTSLAHVARNGQGKSVELGSSKTCAEQICPLQNTIKPWAMGYRMTLVTQLAHVALLTFNMFPGKQQAPHPNMKEYQKSAPKILVV